MFWLTFGTAAAVIGLALMALAAGRLPARANLLASGLFDGGLGVLLVGVGLLLWSLGLFIAHRRGASGEATAEATAPSGRRRRAGPSKAELNNARDLETIRLYFAERDKLFHPPKEEDRS